MNRETENSETEELKRRLELATSTGVIDSNTLDEETAMMRESWQALSRLLVPLPAQPFRAQETFGHAPGGVGRPAPNRRESPQPEAALVQDRVMPRPELLTEVTTEVRHAAGMDLPVGLPSKVASGVASRVDRTALEDPPTRGPSQRAHPRSSGMWLLGCAASALTLFALWLLRPPVSQEERPQVAGNVRNGAVSQPGERQPQLRPGTNASANELAWDDNWERTFTRSEQLVRRFQTAPVDDISLSRLEDQFSELARDFESNSL